MKGCTYRLSLEDIITMPKGLLVLHGADGEKDPAEPDSGSSEDTGDKDDKSKGSGDNEDDEDEGKKAAPDAKDRRIAGLEEEKDRHAKKRLEAENTVAELRAQIKKMEKDGTPDDAIKNQNDELTKTNAALAADNAKLRLENAFLTNKSYDWVDPEAALKLVDLAEVETDEKTGKLIGLDSALTKLAKAKPYLLKKVDEDSKDDPKPPARKTGTPPKPGTQKESDKAAQEAKLRQLYPALRR